MGEERKIVCHLSVAPTVGAAFITNGKILDFNSAYPTAITSLYGVEAAVRCDTFVRKIDDPVFSHRIPIFVNLFKPISNPDKLLHRAELVIRYEHGTSDQRVTQDDFPLSNNILLKSLVRFGSSRATSSHHLELLTLWSPGTPFYQTESFKFLDPWFGFGFRLIHIEVNNDREDGNLPEESSTTTGAAALAVRASLVEYHHSFFTTGVLMGGSLLAGGCFGFEGYFGLKLEFPLKNKN